jgi:hypothetical protein
MRKRELGSLRRRTTSLLTALSFVVLAVSGVLAFLLPFSIEVVGLHALMGFVFVGLIGIHLFNNVRPMKGYLRSRALWVSLAITSAFGLLFYFQPGPIKSLLGLSGNFGPAMERFEMSEDGMVFQYAPAAEYRLELRIKTGSAYDLKEPPQVAIWLENQGAYHIKTLLTPKGEGLPYWEFKHAGWEKAKAEAAKEPDAVSGPTPNGSFDPADYILPADAENSTPYKLLIEINQADNDQSSLVYAVEIDNLDPSTYQLLELVGYPKREDEDGKEAWSLFYVDESVGSALELIDSALLVIDRR